MLPRTQGNSFHHTLYEMVSNWMPTVIRFSTSGRFILIPDIDHLDTILISAASSSGSGDAIDIPKVSRGLAMGSYSSLRRQLCAYNFHSIDPQTLPVFEIPSGTLFSGKSRVWFHVHFYRGATVWKDVPRMIWSKTKTARRAHQASSSPPSSPLPSTTEPDSPSVSPRLFRYPSKAVLRKSAVSYSSAAREIDRNPVNVAPAVALQTPASSFTPAAPTALAASSQRIESATQIYKRPYKMSLSYILNSPLSSNRDK